MLGLSRKLRNEDRSDEPWGMVGLLHDADYEKYPNEHPRKIIEELKKRNEDVKIINAIKAHAYGFNGMNVMPKTPLEWAIYTSDELTGFIVAVTLIRPSKKIADVTVENVLSKWDKKDFAKGVNRNQIELCEEKLGIKLPDFIQIVLDSMKNISSELGL
jgi:predicted hydrolase (HD superfamily)